MNIIIRKNGERTKGRRTYCGTYGQTDPVAIRQRGCSLDPTFKCILHAPIEYLFDQHGCIINTRQSLTE